MSPSSQPGPSERPLSNRARPFATPARRLLIVGLDGATLDVLDPLVQEGRMPRLAAAMGSGACGVLRSTIPPITPAAWTTFLTGKQPGTHGIIDFERFDPATNKLLFNSTRCLDHVRNLWQILGDKGLKVGSVNVPMTYPPIPVNGFVISGFETPGPDCDFVHPPELKSRILKRWPDPTLKTRWRRKTFGGDRLFAENVAYLSRSFHQGAAMTTWCGDELGWDVLMVVFKLVDNLQHKTWKYIDPRWSARNLRRRDLALHAFEELDTALGTLFDYARKGDAAVLIVSDHGHGSLEGKVQPNLLLKRWGYLALRGRGVRTGTRGAHLWDRLRGKKSKFARVDDVGRDLAVDFSRTRACVMHAGMAGFVYVNLQGRQPTGIVGPDGYEPLRDELKERFEGKECRVRDPQGNVIPLFAEVHKPEELYGCRRKDQPWLPDLLLVPHASLAVVRRIRGAKAVRWLSYRRLEGTHRSDGVLIAAGPGIAKRSGVGAHIVDCAPTILAMLGLRIPDDMEGRVVTELFLKPPVVETEPAECVPPLLSSADIEFQKDTAQDQWHPAEEAYSAEELAKVTARLAELGYLE